MLGPGVGAEAGVEGERGVAGGEDVRAAPVRPRGVGRDPASLEAAAVAATRSPATCRRRPRRRRTRSRCPSASTSSSTRPLAAGALEQRAGQHAHALARGAGRRTSGRARSPRIGASGASSASTIVTSTPSPRAVAATSWPMKPAPTIASRAPGPSSAAQAAGVGEGAQVVDVLEALEERQAPRARRRWRSAACRRRAARRRSRPTGRALRVEPLGPRPEQQLDLASPRTSRRAGRRPRPPRRSPASTLLGERRPVVGRLGLGADDPHRPVVAAPAQGLGAALAGEAAADDQDAVRPSSRLLQDGGPEIVERPAGPAGRSARCACPRPAVLARPREHAVDEEAADHRRGQRSPTSGTRPREASVPAPSAWTRPSR